MSCSTTSKNMVHQNSLSLVWDGTWTIWIWLFTYFPLAEALCLCFISTVPLYFCFNALTAHCGSCDAAVMERVRLIFRETSLMSCLTLYLGHCGKSPELIYAARPAGSHTDWERAGTHRVTSETRVLRRSFVLSVFSVKYDTRRGYFGERGVAHFNSRWISWINAGHVFPFSQRLG